MKGKYPDTNTLPAIIVALPLQSFSVKHNYMSVRPRHIAGDISGGLW